MSEVKIASKYRDITSCQTPYRVYACPQCDKMAKATCLCVNCELKFNVCPSNEKHLDAVYMHLIKATVDDEGDTSVVYPDPMDEIQLEPLLFASVDVFGEELFDTDDLMKLEWECPVCLACKVDPEDEDDEDDEEDDCTFN